jgi:hypothetical protein
MCPNVITNIRYARLHERAICAMRKKLDLSSDGGDSAARNAIEATVVTMVMGYGGICV